MARTKVLVSEFMTRAYHPLKEIFLSRLREFYREPEAVFWVYGFPLIMVVALGIAFRNKPVEQLTVDVQDGPGAASVVDRLAAHETFKVEARSAEECRTRLRTGKSVLVVIPGSPGGDATTYWFDPTRPEGLLARNTVNNALQEAAGRKAAFASADREMTDPGGRYVDFLIPGLLGMSLMGGGLWGIGFVTVDMRIRKLLKRFLATPMKKSDFLLGIMLSRFAFTVPEVLVMLGFAWLAFGVVIQGSVLAVIALIILGAITFSGIGLLVASRAKTIEAVSGLMNLVMLPMWILSGIFFSPERFPAAAQPFIKALPLTPLISALREVMLDGASLGSQLSQLAILAAYAVVSFALALWLFRWN